MPLEPPPTLLCPAGDFGPVAADVHAPAWRKIAPVALRETVTGGAPNQATDLRVAVSGMDLRVLFDCVDEDVWATKTMRDDRLFEEEVVEVFLDPVGDLECYFELELNPLNTVLDLVLRKSVSGLKKETAWDCEGLRTAVQLTPRGWTAELAIPFESLMPGCARMPGWRCNFTRIDRPRGHPRELSAWSPTGLALFHVPERFGVLRLGE
ncbi:MAG TPA: carbohydrate-binding family 9-like protein [Chthoniobacteraceae bacterium]|jgi:hypothetical protein|nr:carbohydrate-binding family 9-like protein [Chthoniobacteraceae bacterium]